MVVTDPFLTGHIMHMTKEDRTDSMFYPLTICALQIVFMKLFMIIT